MRLAGLIIAASMAMAMPVDAYASRFTYSRTLQRLETRLARLAERIDSLVFFSQDQSASLADVDSAPAADNGQQGNPVAINSIDQRIPGSWVVDTGYIVNGAFEQIIDEYGNHFTVDAITGWEIFTPERH